MENITASIIIGLTLISGSGATIIKTGNIWSDFLATSNGKLNVTFRSEVSGSACNFLRGSICRLYNTT
jgi:hypothetical protein